MEDQILMCSNEECVKNWNKLKSENNGIFIYHCKCHCVYKSVYGSNFTAYCWTCKQNLCESCIFEPRFLLKYFAGEITDFCQSCYLIFLDQKKTKVEAAIRFSKKKEKDLRKEICRIKTL